MTASIFYGPLKLGLTRDRDGYRTYKVKYLVKTTSILDGPVTVMFTPGLPIIGTIYAVGNDLDPWCYLTPDLDIQPYMQNGNDPVRHWTVGLTYTNKFDSERCQDTTIEDPLLEPQKVSGTFVSYQKEMTRDRNGARFKMSSHEPITGDQVTFDDHRATVTIEQNVPDLGLTTFTQYMNRVNSVAMWGLSTRRVKLSNVTWSRKVYGVCNYYYTRTFDFDIYFDGFDKEALDEGYKVLHGHWYGEDGTGTATGSGLEDLWVLDQIDGLDPNPNNPQHFDRYKDRNGENSKVILDGAGKPLADGASPYFHDIEYYKEANFFEFGIPTSF